MRDSSVLVLLFGSVLLLGFLQLGKSFSPPAFRTTKAPLLHPTYLPRSTLFQSSDDSGDAPKRRRKRKKRKQSSETVDAQEEPPPAPDFTARDDGPVQLQVQDVRDLVGGGGANKATATTESPSLSSPPTTTIPAKPADTTLSDDSLQMLLQDAKEFQSLEEKEGSATASTEEEVFSIPVTFNKVLSTVVTIDFFVVCGFLLWFLAGIFCSYILKDDTVQIAFNQLFQPVVQPALGILMIGAIAGSFGSKDEEEAA